MQCVLQTTKNNCPRYVRLVLSDVDKLMHPLQELLAEQQKIWPASSATDSEVVEVQLGHDCTVEICALTSEWGSCLACDNTAWQRSVDTVCSVAPFECSNRTNIGIQKTVALDLIMTWLKLQYCMMCSARRRSGQAGKCAGRSSCSKQRATLPNNYCIIGYYWQTCHPRYIGRAAAGLVSAGLVCVQRQVFKKPPVACTTSGSLKSWQP